MGHGRAQREYVLETFVPYMPLTFPCLSDCLKRSAADRAAPPDTPHEPLSPVQIDAMFARLHSPDGRRYPENWLARTVHPSLPPRPDLWPTPRGMEIPLPTDLQLNPFLLYRNRGRPPIHFDLRTRVVDIMLYGRLEHTQPQQPPNHFGYLETQRADVGPSTVRTDAGPSSSSNSSSSRRGKRRALPYGFVDFGVDGANGAQPATYPAVSCLRITALADDWHAVFPWPMTVFSRHEALPVSVKDVLNALVANFEARLWNYEVQQMSDGRKALMNEAYWRRMKLEVGGKTPPKDDGLRRVDYLGDASFFRGLAPAQDGEGLMLFVGPPS